MQSKAKSCRVIQESGVFHCHCWHVAQFDKQEKLDAMLATLNAERNSKSRAALKNQWQTYLADLDGPTHLRLQPANCLNAHAGAITCPPIICTT